ncbi:unnamed protein product [Polarella glacialis]|uniref:Uncharacterized protein n=1 Tax=Polarella glacialis TaxID=89957 RepID=A0A813HAV5_POLGL|nr:unnamed protein product [Polarella glacialis]
MLCTACGQFQQSSRKGITRGLCCNKCPNHGPWCSQFQLPAAAGVPNATPPLKRQRRASPPRQPFFGNSEAQSSAPSGSGSQRPGRAQGVSSSAPSSLGLPKPATLPPRHGALVRNLTQELRAAEEDNPEVLKLRRTLESSVSKGIKAKQKWDESTKFLAIGGQTAMDVAAKEAALNRSRTDVAKATEELAAHDQVCKDEDGDAHSTMRSGAKKFLDPIWMLRLQRSLEQAKRRLLQDEQGLRKALELKALDTQLQACEAETALAETRLQEALVTVLALRREVSRFALGASELEPIFAAVRGPIEKLLVAPNVAAVEELVTTEWCTSLSTGVHGVEVTLHLEAVVAQLSTVALLEGGYVLLRLDALAKEQTPADAEGGGAVSSYWPCYARLGSVHARSFCEAAEELRLDVAGGNKDVAAGKAGRPPLRVKSLQLLRAWVGLQPDVRLGTEVADALKRLLLRQRDGLDNLLPPSSLQASLRPYQVQGFAWMAANAENGLGSLLADEMGLGKTLQTLALLLYLRESGRLHRPVLVVSPLSVMSNWKAEIASWAPGLRAHVYHGPGRKLPANCSLSRQGTSSAASPPVSGIAGVSESLPAGGPAGEAEVVLTTYSTLREDWALLSATARFGGMVLDEAQAIKNSRSQITKAVLEVAQTAVGPVRIALTGTPVENRLAELHSIFSFIVPGYLGAAKNFEQDFAKPLERGCGPDASQNSDASRAEFIQARDLRDRLLAALRPFLLRRSKTDGDIASDLPAKIELVHAVQLTESQRLLYQAVQESAFARVLESLGALEDSDDANRSLEDVVPEAAIEPKGRRVVFVLSMLHALQQVCNHPAAVCSHSWPQGKLDRSDASYSPSHENSGKMTRLLSLLEEVLAPRSGPAPGVQLPGEKVLIFSQYVQTVSLLQSTVQEAHPEIEVLSFHGQLSMEQRSEVQERFKNDPRCAVLILTLGSGGVGINLISASHVVHFDRCWNPAREAQATDRAHRIGQCRTVVVHRLICLGTHEERLAKIQDKKSKLAGEIIPGGGHALEKDINGMSLEELRQLFTFSFGVDSQMGQRAEEVTSELRKTPLESVSYACAGSRLRDSDVAGASMVRPTPVLVHGCGIQTLPVRHPQEGPSYGWGIQTLPVRQSSARRSVLRLGVQTLPVRQSAFASCVSPREGSSYG